MLGVDLGVLVDLLPDAVIIVDSQSVIAFVNTEAEQLFRTTRSEMVGQSLDLLIPNRFRQSHARLVAATDGTAHFRAMGAAGSEREFVGLRRDGSEFPAEVALGAIPTENGNFVAAIVRDVERRRQVEHLAAIQEANVAFFANVSHELRTPLTSIIGFCELIEESKSLDAETLGFARMIHRGAAREAALVDDLLFLTSADGPTRRGAAEEVDLVRLVVNSMRSSALIAASGGVRMILAPSPRQIRVLLDPARMRRAIDHVLGNAIKFSPAGDAVHVAVTSDGVWASVMVGDHGPGIPEDEADRIFERLYRGNFARESELPGAGLGLSIIRSIMDRFGGSIALVEVEGPGALFRLTVPLASNEQSKVD